MRAERRSHRGLAALAERQHGVVSLTQLRKLGYSTAAVRHVTATGRLHPVHREVYAVGHAGISTHGRCLAAVLSCGTNARLSHRSAGWLWGLTKRFAVPVEVTASSPRRTRGEIRVHSAAALTDRDHASSEAIPATAVPRTLLDLAAIDPLYIDRALDNAHRLGLLDLIAIDELIGRSRGFRGVARLRVALEIHRGCGFTRSGLERRFLDLVRRSGLPAPSMNFFVAGHELDAYWAAEKFAVELDTYEHHGSPLAFEADRIRQEELKLSGIELDRVTGARLEREPQRVMSRLRELLAQRRRELGLDPTDPR